MATLNQQLTRSIDDAHKISRRHCTNPGINHAAHVAAMRLANTLKAIRDHEMKRELKARAFTNEQVYVDRRGVARGRHIRMSRK